MLIGHKKQWEFLRRKSELGQLSHAYLFSGPKEIGKKFFAVEFAKLLNCSEEKNKPCQKCANCLAIEKNNFPDFIIISALAKDEDRGDSGEIKIAQIRQINNFLSYKSYYGSYKIVVINGAENMNQEAQNCFLKTLEEPKGKTLIILVSSRPDMLLPTIFSRCQTVKFFKPKGFFGTPERIKADSEIMDRLMPVINSSLADKFKYAKSIDFQKQKLEDILEVIQDYFRNALLVRSGINPQKNTPISEKYSVRRIVDIIDLAGEINRKLLFSNINPKLALEILLMEL